MGAVLAGGASSRMGEPKHALRLEDGRAMIELVVDTMRAVCQQVVIVGRIDAGLARGNVMIDDLRSALGPLGGIESLLASGIADQYLVCPCDVPLMSPGSLRLLLAETAKRATVLRREDAREFDPLPARISAAALAVVSRLLDDGRRGVHELMRELGAHEIVLPRSRAIELTNVNTPEDFVAARRQLARTRVDPSLPAPDQPGRHPA